MSSASFVDEDTCVSACAASQDCRYYRYFDKEDLTKPRYESQDISFPTRNICQKNLFLHEVTGGIGKTWPWAGDT